MWQPSFVRVPESNEAPSYRLKKAGENALENQANVESAFFVLVKSHTY